MISKQLALAAMANIDDEMDGECGAASRRVLRRVLRQFIEQQAQGPKYQTVAAEAYQVIGALADGPAFESPEVQRALDHFSLLMVGRHEEAGSILPFHPPAPAAVPEWDRCLAVSETPLVDEALCNFADDPTGDNAVCLVRAVLRAHSTPAAVPEGWRIESICGLGYQVVSPKGKAVYLSKSSTVHSDSVFFDLIEAVFGQATTPVQGDNSTPRKKYIFKDTFTEVPPSVEWPNPAPAERTLPAGENPNFTLGNFEEPTLTIGVRCDCGHVDQVRCRSGVTTPCVCPQCGKDNGSVVVVKANDGTYAFEWELGNE